VKTADTIATAVTLLNALISAAQNAEKYRAAVAHAVAEGRDISNDELAQAAQDLDSAIESAARA